jgi:hypothetical protein
LEARRLKIAIETTNKSFVSAPETRLEGVPTHRLKMVLSVWIIVEASSSLRRSIL